MNTLDHLSPYILTLVTFVPFAGALLLILLPRRDRDIRLGPLPSPARGGNATHGEEQPPWLTWHMSF